MVVVLVAALSFGQAVLLRCGQGNSWRRVFLRTHTSIFLLLTKIQCFVKALHLDPSFFLFDKSENSFVGCKVCLAKPLVSLEKGQKKEKRLPS